MSDRDAAIDAVQTTAALEAAQRLGITPAEAKWILENTDIAAGEGQLSDALQPEGATALGLQLAELAGVDRGEYWWLADS